MASHSNQTEKRFIESVDLANILKRVLRAGSVDPEDIRRKVCYVAKIDSDTFDEWMVDRFDLMKKVVQSDLLNQLLVQANVRKKAEIDADLGLKVLERRESERWRPNQKIEVVIANPEVLARIGRVTAEFLSPEDFERWVERCQQVLSNGDPGNPSE